MGTGTVKFFDLKNKFGFITDDDTREELFVHQKELKEPVLPGDKVSYKTIDRQRGKAAIMVQKVPAWADTNKSTILKERHTSYKSLFFSILLID